MTPFEAVVADDIEDEGVVDWERMKSIQPYFRHRKIPLPPDSILESFEELIDPGTGRPVGCIFSTKRSQDSLADYVLKRKS